MDKLLDFLTYLGFIGCGQAQINQAMRKVAVNWLMEAHHIMRVEQNDLSIKDFNMKVTKGLHVFIVTIFSPSV